MRRPTHNTAKLPRQLLQELGDPVIPSSGKKRKYTGVLNRKEKRKDARAQQKLSHGQGKINREERHRPRENIQRTNVLIASRRSRPNVSESQSSVSGNRHGTSSPSPASQAPSVPKSTRKRLATDDAEIAALEAALGMKGKKKLPKSFEDDGLDSLLDNIDDVTDVGGDYTGKRKRSNGDQWHESKRRKSELHTQYLNSSDRSEDSISSGTRDFDGLSEGESEVGEDSGMDELDRSGISDESSSRDAGKLTRENPYVAPAPIGAAKYVPPSLRNEDRDDLSHLSRRLQGYLNRLSEANMVSILEDVETFYRSHPRRSVTDTLLSLLLGLLSDPAILSDSFIILHAGFIAAVYKIIGTDFGAQAVQIIYKDFEKNYAAISSQGGNGKKLTNVISLLAELYNFQVIGSNLIYDYIRLCLEGMSEDHTEILLRIIRIAGLQLRQDDPSSLKDIVVQLHSSIARVGEQNLSVRTKYMIETILNLKNNRVKTKGSNATIASEHRIRMKKTLGSLTTRSLKATEPLRVGFNNLKYSDKVGTWWLLGVNSQDEARDTKVDNNSPNRSRDQDSMNPEMETLVSATTDLAYLAKEQHMNTEIRRSIFVAIMSASDYRDAYVRLIKLRLKKSQELEIPKVLIHCAGAEKTYNPYYTFLSRRLCSDRKLKMTFQFSLWDLFKQMGERDDATDEGPEEGSEEQFELRSLVNFAKMFGILVAEGGLGLGILKNLSFAYLQPKTCTFLEILIITIVLRSQQGSHGTRNENALLALFLKPKEVPGMAGGLQYFLRKVVKNTDIAGSESDTETVRWACRIICDALTPLIMGTATRE